MFVVAPISRVSEVCSIIDAGADEIYCGLLTEEQADDYANIGCLNRRAETSSNLSGFDELSDVVGAARERGIPVSLTLNEFYDEGQARGALVQLEKALRCGVRRFIVSDIGLLRAIRQGGYRDIEIQVSSCTSVFNSASLEFYLEFSPSRIILNRQLSLAEIGAIQSRFPRPDKEVFVLNERCHNIDGLCTFLHGRLSPRYNLVKRALLALSRNRDLRFLPRGVRVAVHRHVVKNSLSCCFGYRWGKRRVFLNEADHFLQACGVCALRELSLMGIRYLKISGRSLLADKARDIRILKEAVGLLSAVDGETGFREAARHIVRDRYGRACAPEYCYYGDGPLNSGLRVLAEGR